MRPSVWRNPFTSMARIYGDETDEQIERLLDFTRKEYTQLDPKFNKPAGSSTDGLMGYLSGDDLIPRGATRRADDQTLLKEEAYDAYLDAFADSNLSLDDLTDQAGLFSDEILMKNRAKNVAKKGGLLAGGAAVAGALAPEDAEATPLRILTQGDDVAGALYKRLMRAQQAGLTPGSAMKQAMHDDTFSTYNKMIKEAHKRDGGPAGAFYKAQIKDLIGPIAKDPRFNKSKFAQDALREWTLTRLKRGPDYRSRERGSVDPTTLLPIAGIGGAAAMMTPLESEAALVDDRTQKESLFDLSGISWLANPAIRSVAGSLFDLETERSERPMKALYSAGEAAYQATQGEDFEETFEDTWDDMSLSEIIDMWGERSPALGAAASVGSMVGPF